MGEAESFERESLADVPATVADDGDAAACTGGADPTDSGPGDLGVASDAGATRRAEPTFGPPPDPAAATVDGRRDAGTPGVPGGAPRKARALRAAPTIPGYEIVGELGRGGMGVVYQARQIRLLTPAERTRQRAEGQDRRARRPSCPLPSALCILSCSPGWSQ